MAAHIDKFEDILQLVEDGVQGDRDRLVASLITIRGLKDQRKAIDDELSILEGRVRSWLEQNPGEPLIDGEHGISATLREKNKPAEIDLISAAQKPENDTHIARAAGMGLLSARLTALRAQKGKVECADVLLGFEMPGGMTTELRIEQSR